MNATQPLYEAYRQTVQEGGLTPKDVLDPAQRKEQVAEYLAHLQTASLEIEAPLEPAVVDDFAYAMLNREAPLEDRRLHANRAFDMAKKSAFEHVPSVRGLNMAAVSERADKLSLQAVDMVVEGASSYPAKTGNISEMRDQLANLLYPEKKTPEDKAVAATAMFNVLQPYLVDRVLELDIYDPAKLQEQVQELRQDVALMQRFHNSVSYLAEFTLTGKTTKSHAEIADKLFDIGPIFVQLGQSFTNAAEKDGKNPNSAFVGNIGKAMQEGVAMPDEAQKQTLAANLPEGLELDDVFSSAKIAYVAKTKAPEGEFVTKIKRPNSEQAIKDNERMLSLVTACVVAYIETHAGDTPMAQKLSFMKNSVPFALAVTRADMMEELDFANERRLQQRGGDVLAEHAGIIVPKVIEKYSDDNHITMQPVHGERIDRVPANRDYLKNAMVLLLKGRKEKLIHGDMHGGNVKAAVGQPEGTLVAYDWGLSVEVPERFEANLVSFLASVATKNPQKMATAYRRIQNPKLNQVTQEEAEAVAQEAIDAMEEQRQLMAKTQPKMSATQRKMQEVNGVFRNFVGIMGMKHQGILDTRYTQFMRSSVSLARVMADELSKPEYAKRSYKASAILKSAAAAVKEVYLPRKKR